MKTSRLDRREGIASRDLPIIGLFPSISGYPGIYNSGTHKHGPRSHGTVKFID